MSVALTGAQIRLYVNGHLYREAQKIDYTIDYGEKAIYGVDSSFAQEIHGTRCSVTGSVTGLRLKMSGGLQGISARSLILEAFGSPYISIMLKDRASGMQILDIEQAKVTNERVTIEAGSTVKLSFNFIGDIPWQPLDRE